MAKGILYFENEVTHLENYEALPSIVETDVSPFCFRCGNNQAERFANLPSNERYCRNCLLMKRVSSLQKFYYQKPAETERIYFEAPLMWEGVLSFAQQRGADAILNAIQEQKSLLLWSVAGSGKTEMMFQGIEAGLEKGLRICLASPRVDVCIELAPRLQDVFPDVPQVCLYGDSEAVFNNETFVIATTHQLMRFYRYFDLIFIDEVDAFPYAKDPCLEYTVRKAGSEGAIQIFVTATPERKWQQECLIGKRNYVKIPARYHGFPLPVPHNCWIGDWQKQLNKKRISKKVLTWIMRYAKLKKPILIFFPKIDVMFEFSEVMKRYGFEQLTTVHSADKLRKEKVQQLRDGAIQILLTTTILERGVTFADVQVAVFGSEGSIFTEAALVQIAGRVGRKRDFPAGEVCFFHFGKTNEMMRAIQHIKLMNKIGWEEGLLGDK
ncbi:MULTISPECIES: DEAD/DEAH box helicase [Listeria]|uniref:DEAD/DEAH box helicase n=1 Tax=Listeria TaxID=1637 RepID=UPI000B58AD50|nr:MULTISPECIES: DEAD/DEAH box helicase [Listeria]